MADFWAGYLSGIAGIIIGSPLDIIKTRSQSQVLTSTLSWYQSPSSLVRGTAAPIFGQGALNALLFFSYNRSLLLLGAQDPAYLYNDPLWKIFFGGACSGIVCFVITTPTELVKCRAQVASRQNSWDVVRELYRAYGPIRGFYLGGMVTGLRDAVGYGFYFWAYEGSKRYLPTDRAAFPEGSWVPKVNTLLSGGIAGMAGWATIYPLDVVKTMVQVQAVGGAGVELRGLLGRPLVVGGTARSGFGAKKKELGAWECAKKAYREGGVKVFWNGIWVCLGRAFIVNAVTFFTYEWTMEKLSGMPAGTADGENPTR